MSTAAPTFRTGGDAAQEAAKSTGGNFARVNYFSLKKDEDTAVLRYVTDSLNWIWVDQHASVPTKAKPANSEGNWPKSMPAVCRHDEAFKGIYGDCYICDNDIENEWGRPCKPAVRVWALACLREQVICTTEMHEADPERFPENKIGKIVGYTDATREVAITNEKGEDTGKTKQELALVVVNMAPSNYFNGLQAIYSASGEEGEPDTRTITNCDFLVKRAGTGTDTEYYHVAKKETPNLHGPLYTKDQTTGAVSEVAPAAEKWAKYIDAAKEQNLDLGSIVADKASDDYYARFFDPSKTPAERKSKDGDKSERPATPTSSGSDDVDEDKLAAMRERVRSSSSAAPKAAAASVDVD